MMEEERKETPETLEADFEEEFSDETQKHGLLQRIWAVITHKQEMNGTLLYSTYMRIKCFL